MKEKLRQFMMGRYGTDNLNRFLLVVTLILIVLSWFTWRLFYLLGLACMVYAYFRMMSRNCAARSMENAKYMQAVGHVKSLFSRRKTMWSQRDAYKFFKCPNCKQQIRIPKGHGQIEITCPKCHNHFQGRS